MARAPDAITSSQPRVPVIQPLRPPYGIASLNRDAAQRKVAESVCKSLATGRQHIRLLYSEQYESDVQSILDIIHGALIAEEISVVAYTSLVDLHFVPKQTGRSKPLEKWGADVLLFHDFGQQIGVQIRF